MIRFTRPALTIAAALFGLCTIAAACGTGGVSRPTPYSPPRNPLPYQTSYATAKTAKVVPPKSGVRKPVVAVAPQARITVVSTDTAATAPVGRIQIASATPEPKVEEVAKVEPKPEPKVEPKVEEVAKTPAAEGADPAKLLEGLVPAGAEPAKIADALKGLVGPWMAVSRQGDGELSTVELLLNDNGWAKLTVPGADGKPSTSTRKIEFENNELKLTGGDADVLLGKLVEFDSRQMVLERQGGEVTFVRP